MRSDRLVKAQVLTATEMRDVPWLDFTMSNANDATRPRHRRVPFKYDRIDGLAFTDCHQQPRTCNTT